MIKLLEQLTHVTGPSGFEQKIAKVVYDIVTPLADTVRVDALGNILATIKGTDPQAPSLVVSAHMDEVGFIVKKIETNGLLRFEKIGGHDDRILLAQRVRILTKQGPITGVIGTISAHYQKFDDPNKIRRYQELYIDCGVASPEEATEIGIQIGDPISWATDIEVIGKHRVLGKALDDRAGCAVQVATLERLAQTRQPGDVHFLFSVQEEVGLRGATVGAFDLDADFALAIDATVVGDTPENISDHCLTLGKGPGIKIMDSSFIAHPVVKEHLIAVAEAGQIPYQPEIFMGIGTDAGRLHMTKGGIPTGVISIPQRYAHSPIEVMDLRDIEQTVDLLEGAIRALPQIAGKTFLD
jgi:tetrahedral aminopeptidase